ncbi:MAG: hypothetical protein KDD69_03325 [Bdellovibrionales bacterium]|nr:hypothetical protein [Bdellovibrionales bacterium]
MFFRAFLALTLITLQLFTAVQPAHAIRVNYIYISVVERISGLPGPDNAGEFLIKHYRVDPFTRQVISRVPFSSIPTNNPVVTVAAEEAAGVGVGSLLTSTLWLTITAELAILGLEIVYIGNQVHLVADVFAEDDEGLIDEPQPSYNPYSPNTYYWLGYKLNKEANRDTHLLQDGFNSSSRFR